MTEEVLGELCHSWCITCPTSGRGNGWLRAWEHSCGVCFPGSGFRVSECSPWGQSLSTTSCVRAEGEEFPALQHKMVRPEAPDCKCEAWANMGKRRQENGLVVEDIFYPEAHLLESSHSPQESKHKGKINSKNQASQQPDQQAVVHSSPKIGCVISETLPLPLVLLPSPMNSPAVCSYQVIVKVPYGDWGSWMQRGKGEEWVLASMW